ncbi:MAG: hypothetical protein ACJ8DJ_12235, partial [Gemmatimonadales bacterium]
MPDGHAWHVGNGIERTRRAVERDAEVPGPLCGLLRLEGSPRKGEAGAKRDRDTPDHGVAGERKTKYTAPIMQSA